MKSILLCLSILCFSVQGLAVAQTASGAALQNTSEIVNDCEQTSDPNVLAQCQQRAAQQAAIDERAAAKKKKEKLAIAAAAIGAGFALWPFFKNRRDAAGASSNAAPPLDATQQTSGNLTCEGGRTADNLAGTCSDDSHIKIDATNNCMCIGVNCFDFRLPADSDLSEALAGSTTLQTGSAGANSLAFNIEGKSSAINFNETAVGAEPSAGLNVSPQAMTKLRAALADGSDSTNSIQACNEIEVDNSSIVPVVVEEPQEQVAGSPDTVISNQRRSAEASSVEAMPTTSPPPQTSVRGLSDEERRLRGGAPSKLTQRMDHAVKARGQFAPVQYNEGVE